MPPLDGATGWLNSPPLSPAELRGRVVRAWAERYGRHGLVVLGVHTPEFDVEHDPGNVRRAVADLRVGYPVALDRDHAVWTAFDNHYWPALHLVDAEGRIRHHRFGESGYDQTEMLLRQLLVDAGAGDLGDPAPVRPAGIEAAADWDDLWSGESYLGSDRTENFVPGGRAGTAADRLRLNDWTLAGDWTVHPQAVGLDAAGGRLVYRSTPATCTWSRAVTFG